MRIEAVQNERRPLTDRHPTDISTHILASRNVRLHDVAGFKPQESFAPCSMSYRKAIFVRRTHLSCSSPGGFDPKRQITHPVRSAARARRDVINVQDLITRAVIAGIGAFVIEFDQHIFAQFKALKFALLPKAWSHSRHSRSSSTPWKGKEDARLLLTRLNMRAVTSDFCPFGL